jgi:hypothetical protein
VLAAARWWTAHGVSDHWVRLDLDVDWGLIIIIVIDEHTVGAPAAVGPHAAVGLAAVDRRMWSSIVTTLITPIIILTIQPVLVNSVGVLLVHRAVCGAHGLIEPGEVEQAALDQRLDEAGLSGRSRQLRKPGTQRIAPDVLSMGDLVPRDFGEGIVGGHPRCPFDVLKRQHFKHPIEHPTTDGHHVKRLVKGEGIRISAEQVGHGHLVQSSNALHSKYRRAQRTGQGFILRMNPAEVELNRWRLGCGSPSCTTLTCRCSSVSTQAQPAPAAPTAFQQICFIDETFGNFVREIPNLSSVSRSVSALHPISPFSCRNW